VVLALPEDMLSREVAVADARPHVVAEAHPGQDDMLRLQQLLNAAKSPMMVLGGSGWTRQACADITRFAEANALPVGCAFRRQDLLDNNHPHYVGDVGIGINPVLAERVKMADVLLLVGTRLGEMASSGYTLVDIPVPRQKLVHVHAAGEELGRVYQPEIAIHSAPGPFARAAAALTPVENPPWKGSVAEARADFEAWSGRREIPGRVQMWDIVDYLNKHAGDGIYTNGAGNFATWLHRFHRYTGLRSQVAPTSGAMGYGVPAAIAAKLAHPERTVVCFAGDGDFLMSGMELATAVQYNAPVVIVILNNGMYGTIRMHQEKHYPGPRVGHGAAEPALRRLRPLVRLHGRDRGGDGAVRPAFERIVASGKPGVIDIHLDPQAITPNTTLDKIRAALRRSSPPCGRCFAPDEPGGSSRGPHTSVSMGRVHVVGGQTGNYLFDDLGKAEVVVETPRAPRGSTQGLSGCQVRAQIVTNNTLRWPPKDPPGLVGRKVREGHLTVTMSA
jgi:acetolactate synthase-1/2/3 large subunit